MAIKKCLLAPYLQIFGNDSQMVEYLGTWNNMLLTCRVLVGGKNL